MVTFMNSETLDFFQRPAPKFGTNFFHMNKSLLNLLGECISEERWSGKEVSFDPKGHSHPSPHHNLLPWDKREELHFRGTQVNKEKRKGSEKRPKDPEGKQEEGPNPFDGYDFYPSARIDFEFIELEFFVKPKFKKPDPSVWTNLT